MKRLRLAILISGRGSNMESLIRASKEGRMAADVALVLSNKEDAEGLAVARSLGVRAVAVPSKGASKEDHEAQLIAHIDAERPDLVLLAGYMRIVSAKFVQHYEGRLLNIHPSLLPAFRGLHAQEQAHAAGVRVAGCTTHFVTEELDGGPIVMQASVDVPPGTSAEELGQLILAKEHVLYPATVDAIARGKVRFDNGRVVWT